VILFQDITRHDKLPFAEYLALPGYSQSYLKREVNGLAPGLDITYNMRLGSMVDAILTEPDKVDITQDVYEPAKAIAAYLKQAWGHLLPAFKTQVSYTGTMVVNGWAMPIKGRLDYELTKHATIDLKVTASRIKDLKTLIEFMGYDKQLFNYSGLAKTPKQYIIFYSLTDKRTELVQIDFSKKVIEFWTEKIEKFGMPIENV
jgi:hypothetical protein